MSAPELHARAVARFEQGAADEAIALLRASVAEQLEPEAVNDLAVMLAGAGDVESARALPPALRRLAPRAAHRQRSPSPLGGGPPATPSPRPPRAERRPARR